jgi:Fe-S-cluster-containing dehydrogenase component
VPGRYVLELENADVIVSLGADLFGGGDPLAIKYARDFASRRRLDDKKSANTDTHTQMSRLYVIESLHTITGACADHRMAAHPIEILSSIKLIFDSIVVPLVENDSYEREEKRVDEHAGAFIGQIDRIAADLKAHAGRSVVIAGPDMPQVVHSAVAAINKKLGNIDKTIRYYADKRKYQSYTADLGDLCQQVGNGKVKTLLILGGNPVYNSPADFLIGDKLQQIPNRIHLALHEDETSQLCTWHLSRRHYLESWGDVRTYDGTISITQPLIEPLFDGRSAIELLATISNDKEAIAGGGQFIVRRSIESVIGDSFSDWAWKKALIDGFITGSAWNSIKAQDLPPAIDSLLSHSLKAEIPSPEEIQQINKYVFLQLFTDCKIFDGRFTNNGWLQELPDPMTRQTWGNAALMSPQTAAKFGIQPDEIVALEAYVVDSDEIVASFAREPEPIVVPVYILPGMADNIVGLACGYGRSHSGNIGNGVGVNAYRLSSNEGKFRGYHPQVKMRPTGQKAKLATVQDHHVFDSVGKRAIQDRIPEIVIEGTLEKYRANPSLGAEKTAAKSLFQEHKFDGRVDGRNAEGANPLGLPDHHFHRWGLIVDLSACTGCGACVVACQAENNIPIVGKEQVLLGREMHWIRVDRYFREGDEPASVHQPVLCMHCQNAPCESVCPVGATTHSREGINMMTYNRCVGVRYCLNNCPYKVRRFNFFDYNRGQLTDLYTPNLARRPISELLRMQKNPDVTVRMRGVMEKCNYCVQRIEHARIVARREGDRPIRDGEIQTACQQSCPAQAITFGDLNDPDSRVSRLAAQARAYGLLDDYLHTEPRTRYLAKVRNVSKKT